MSQCQESDSDNESEELPPAIENPESEDPLSTDKVPFEDAGGDGGRPTVE